MNTNESMTDSRFKTLFEVSRKINSQLDLDKVLDEIMDLAVELLKAEKGLVLFRETPDSDTVVKVARSTDGRSIDNMIAMSRSIVKKVIEDEKTIFMERIPELEDNSISESINRFKLKSVLCVPLRTTQRLIGAIYLDTTNTQQLFNATDVFFLEAFANLSGIAIENAKNYQAQKDLNENLEQRVQDRTQALQEKHEEVARAYRELKDTQAQLVQSKKMAALGTLVAGIAHEVNTPLGAINSNIDMFKRSIQKLGGQMAALRPEVAEDQLYRFDKILGAMSQLNEVNRKASIRIDEIIKALKNFARLDEEELKSVNVHEGIESTLKLIQHFYAGRIDINRQYDTIPLFLCRARQLNQVFMNILVNACQAINDRGNISIRTHSNNDHITIDFIDDGAGIPVEDVEKIFDPGFTTKGVGVGKGIGLAIAFKIVEDHSGKLLVESKVGEGSKFSIQLPYHRLNSTN